MDPSRPRAAGPLACALCLILAACAGGGPEGPRREVLGEERARLPATISADPLEDPPDSARFRAAPSAKTAYRLAVEWSGEREEFPLDGGRSREPLKELHATELEFTEVPVPGRTDLFTVVLDGLHYRLTQTGPALEREVELGGDRMRTRANGETVFELQGAQPAGDITPRKLLGRVFGTVRLDPTGNVRAMRPHGTPAARRWLSEIPLLRLMAYARPPLPAEPVTGGSTWLANRLPTGPAGELGLLLEVRYALGGFRSLDGVPCAWLNIDASLEGEEVEALGAFVFERVRARMQGEAWIELETSRIRLLQLEDEIRVAYVRGNQSRHRLRHRGTVRLELRDPDVEPSKWLDGSSRFGPR